MAVTSKELIDVLNDSKIPPEVCRGPVTEVLPFLSALRPLSLPKGDPTTHENVYGSHVPFTRIVIGTGEGPSGGRALHYPDPILEEVLHAVDDAGDGNSVNPNGYIAEFFAAREKDIKTGALGSYPPYDNYLLTGGEGGTNDSTGTPVQTEPMQEARRF